MNSSEVLGMKSTTALDCTSYNTKKAFCWLASEERDVAASGMPKLSSRVWRSSN